MSVMYFTCLTYLEVWVEAETTAKVPIVQFCIADLALKSTQQQVTTALLLTTCPSLFHNTVLPALLLELQKA